MIAACMTVAWCGISFSQPKPTIAATVLSLPDDQDDPGYAMYKAGYNLILDESWQDARRKLAEVISKYPKSDYVDDAQYWSAYALMHIDRKKAVEAYKKFLKGYPKSNYYDDAVADLGQLDAPVAVTSYSGTSGSSITVGAGEQAIVTDEGVVVSKAPRGGISYGFSSGMRHLSRELRRGGMHLRMLGHIAPTPTPDNEKIDPETRLKMEALYAIGETKEDEKSFQTLRDVALDLKQSRQLREAAMDALSEFKKFDVFSVYVDIARKDTSRDLQMYAVDYIGEHGKDKNKTVDVLVDLFNSIPKQRTEQVETIFYSIAEVGNDKAVDFLTKVALTNEDYNLRTNAVYLLGSIGSEKARTSLYQILRGK
jgi:tetratricopeptide (TPR) repeat protein